SHDPLIFAGSRRFALGECRCSPTSISEVLPSPRLDVLRVIYLRTIDDTAGRVSDQLRRRTRLENMLGGLLHGPFVEQSGLGMLQFRGRDGRLAGWSISGPLPLLRA